MSISGWLRRLVALSAFVVVSAFVAPGALAAGSPGDPTLTVPIDDSTSGASYEQVFEKVYEGTTEDGTDVYIYVPEGAVGDPSVDSISPQFDPDTSDNFVPCATTPESDFLITQAQIDQLGSELEGKIVRVDEEHFGPMGGTRALVTLVYNVQDESTYDCEETTYIAGYFAPGYLDPASLGMNVMVVDALDWANRVGPQTGNPGGLPYLYEGVIAHELEHLLMEYSDTTEVSWVDEGLADMAIFLNQYPAGGSHVAYHQVFHRETSLNRWGGGLENYGASFTYFLYLWERAGGNGPGKPLTPDGQYDDSGGDKLIKLIFQQGADDFQGVDAAIGAFNAGSGPDLPSARELFKDWVLAVYLDQAGSAYSFANLELGGADDSWGWTVDLANSVFWDGRGIYKGAMPEPRWRKGNVPAQVALPYGTSYERFTNPGSSFGLDFDGSPALDLVPPSGPSHWYGGFANSSENVLDLSTDDDVQSLVFDTWYFIEEGWDYGYVEALVNGSWVPVDVTVGGSSITTDDDPHEQNDGNGITGTSGGAYFVNEPKYLEGATAVLPAGTTDVRFRYSTDAAYLDTGWFVSNVRVDGALATATSSSWQLVMGAEQTNTWLVQMIAPCDLTPGVDSVGESTSGGVYVYRFTGSVVQQKGFSTKCLKSGAKSSVTVAISNLPTGLLSVFDQPYVFRVSNTGSGSKS